MRTRCWICVVAVGAAWLGPAGAGATDQTAAKGAADWLESPSAQDPQNADGSWGATEEIRALYTGEAVVALRAFGRRGAAYFRGVTWLENHALSSSDYRARRILALVPHGDDVSGDRAPLKASSSEEVFSGPSGGRGWGISAAYKPAALDTALAILAFYEPGAPAGFPSDVISDVTKGVNFLKATQMSAGGWAGTVAAGAAPILAPGDPVITALVLQALAASRAIAGVQVDGNGNLAVSFLQGTVGSSSTPLQQAHAALALLRWTPGTAAADVLLGYLKTSQLQGGPPLGGSWGGDVYATAVALRAFAAKLGTDVPDLQEAVIIPDLGLRAGINLARGKNRVDALTRGEMRELTNLDLQNLGIEDLTGILEAENLVTVNLLGNAIGDLSPLEGLPNLVRAVVSAPCDVDADGAIAAADAQRMFRFLSNGTTLTIGQRTAADVAPPGAPDNLVTVGDVVPVLRAAAGESTIGCGN